MVWNYKGLKRVRRVGNSTHQKYYCYYSKDYYVYMYVRIVILNGGKKAIMITFYPYLPTRYYRPAME